MPAGAAASRPVNFSTARALTAETLCDAAQNGPAKIPQLPPQGLPQLKAIPQCLADMV